MKRWTLWSLGGAAALVAGLVACPQFAPDDVCGYAGFCGDSSVGDAGDAGKDGGQLCPSGKEPKDDPSCVTEALGIFVAPAPTGNDTNAGTKTAPVATLKTALQKAKSGNKAIFVCEGSYTESVDIAQTVSIWGGFKCSDWSYSGTQPRFTGSKSDYVVHLDTANDSIIADLELDAIDGAPGTGQSSIGAFVATSQNVKFERVAIHAGKGADGPDGTLQSLAAQWPDAGTLAGHNTTTSTGASANTVNCPAGSGTSTGGKGGNGTLNQAFCNGDPGLPSLGGGIGGDGGAQCSAGTDGNPGDAGVPGTSPMVVGDFTDAGWLPAAGNSGQPGSPGQGGGGGGGRDNGSQQGGGGGGGAGACGGAGGGGGSGGGGSIAVIAFQSDLTITASTLVCTTAGKGGNGVAGENGQSSGGLGGLQQPPGCAGGAGGAGGRGGPGAGGAGGVSVGVLSRGGTVNIDTTTQSKITVAGQGGQKGLGAGGNDGIDGVAQPTLAL
jgi:hypothetical protein